MHVISAMSNNIDLPVTWWWLKQNNEEIRKGNTGLIHSTTVI
jgi:hypothetical protein